MKIVALAARLLLGLVFLVFGLNIYLHFLPLPMPTGVAGQFMVVLFSTRFINVIGLFEVVPALLLLFNRFVPLALALLSPVIFDIVVYHALMAPSGLPLAGFVTLLWIMVFSSVHTAFAGLFQRKI